LAHHRHLDGHVAEPGYRGSRDLAGQPGVPVAWLPPRSARDDRLLDPWRLGVGPAVTAPFPTAGEPGRADALTVVAWNAQVGGGALRGWWGDVRRIAGTDPVVALLQEVYRAAEDGPGSARGAGAVHARAIREEPPGETRMDVVAFAREAGLACFYAPSMGNGDGGEDRGNAVLATVPLSRLAAIELPFDRQRRVAVSARAELGERTVMVCSVHLDNRAPWRRAWRSLGRGRARQMRGLLAALDGFGPAVLGGDLNTWARGMREQAYRLARQRFPEPPVLDGRPTHHFEIGGVLRRSDHLLLRLGPRAEARVARMDESYGSDHYPLIGRVRWEPGAGATREP